MGWTTASRAGLLLLLGSLGPACRHAPPFTVPCAAPAGPRALRPADADALVDHMAAELLYQLAEQTPSGRVPRVVVQTPGAGASEQDALLSALLEQALVQNGAGRVTVLTRPAEAGAAPDYAVRLTSHELATASAGPFTVVRWQLVEADSSRLVWSSSYAFTPPGTVPAP